MSAPRLEWSDTDHTSDGRFAIYSEQVRGEPRWYWLGCSDPADRAVKDALRIDGSTDKRTVKRSAQRIANERALLADPEAWGRG